MAVSDYTDVDTLRNELAPNADDFTQMNRLERAVTDASRAIDAFCRVEPGTFASQTIIRTFDVPPPSLSPRWDNNLRVTDNTRLVSSQGLRVPPLILVSSLKTDENSDGVFETVWTANTDFLLYPLNQETKREIRPNPDIGRYAFPIGMNRVQVAGNWGVLEDSETPLTIRRVALLLAMNYYRRPTQSAAAASQGIGGAAVKFGYLDPDVAALLWSVAGKYREQWIGV